MVEAEPQVAASLTGAQGFGRMPLAARSACGDVGHMMGQCGPPVVMFMAYKPHEYYSDKML